ncbi:hypothetical protein K470DRAFT_265375 [Piedraia hortae CBS 480.64]|uniref:Uncharacterized protein n=1 Tax=Piedraia hortae CBS 480.64 TaxID=1314780 RepID=A0A6A7BX14_9PEZI|nr:hypothetical protein K470DRAFT_265375 [Piedraia hortae CBS 480.64]
MSWSTLHRMYAPLTSLRPDAAGPTSELIEDQRVVACREICSSIELPHRNEDLLHTIRDGFDDTVDEVSKMCYKGKSHTLTREVTMALAKFQPVQVVQDKSETPLFEPHYTEQMLKTYKNVVKHYLCFFSRVAVNGPYFATNNDAIPSAGPNEAIKLSDGGRRTWLSLVYNAQHHQDCFLSSFTSGYITPPPRGNDYQRTIHTVAGYLCEHILVYSKMQQEDVRHVQMFFKKLTDNQPQLDIEK